MNRYVVVDLETTGHSVKKGDEIIEIGLVVIENNQIIDEFSSKIKPEQPIPPFITRLTGMTDQDVANAPTFTEVIPEVLTYLKDAYFVAHQVQFDYHFLNASLMKHGYKPLQMPVIDTVEMSRVLFPRANSFKLEDITDYLDIKHYSPHRALSDAYVTGLLLIKLLDKLNNLPYETLNQISPLTTFFYGDLEQIIFEIVHSKKYKRSPNDINFENGFAIKGTKFDKNKSLPKMSHVRSFGDMLSELNHHGNLTLRTSQTEVAQYIFDAIEQNRHAVVEAETGIGKTLSYLLVAIFYAMKKSHKTLISTSTIQLQHQIQDRDWMMISESFDCHNELAILKSPSHYLNLSKLRYYLDELKDINYDTALSLAIILVWLTETNTGDKDEIQLPSKGEEIWPFISGENKVSDEHSGSYFKTALTKANQASIIVVNHAFLVADQLHQTQRLLNYNHLIIDEAHRLHEVVQKQLGDTLDYVFIAHILNSVEKLTTHPSVERLKHSADQFFRSVHQAVLFLHSEKDALSDTGKIQLSLDQYQLDVILSGSLRQQLNDMLLDLKQLQSILKQNQYNNRWKRLTKQKVIEELSQVHDSLIRFFNDDEDHAKWIDVDQDGAKNSVQLNIEPVNVQSFIQSSIVKQDLPTIFMSATIRTNHSFTSFLEELGLHEDTSCLYLPSPYDYQNQVRAYVPSDFPEIKQVRVEEYDESVATFIVSLIEELNEKVVVLFTSYEMLKSVYKMIKIIDHQQEIPILAQGVQSGSREKLKKMYEKSNHAVLLGTSSFWEGVDLDHKSLKIVVMVRLPFDTPNHPMFQAKSRHLEEHNKNAFYHWMLPQAILKFRQAFGRLIRSESDRGIFIVLDQRLMTKPYGKQFINSIPEVPLLHDKKHQLFKDAKNWLLYNDYKGK